MNISPSLFKRKPKVIVILGQTAVGKTDLSLELAENFDGEIISADSRQVYRGLDIGTAKIKPQEMRGIPHHMIDVADPHNAYTVQEFQTAGEKIIKDILARKKTPIICGGSGLYIDALIYNQAFPAVPPNPSLRKELETMETKALFAMLEQQDKKRARTIDSDNKVRLIRALEIAMTLGSVPKVKKHSPYSVLFIGLLRDPEDLSSRIQKRVIDRFEQENMLDEARELHLKGLSYERMHELGLEYRYMAQHLEGFMSYEAMMEGLIQASKQFAKRQMTWFKRNKDIHWFQPNQQEAIFSLVKKFLK